jgi:DNA-binding MarR family transcriptional regulator
MRSRTTLRLVPAVHRATHRVGLYILRGGRRAEATQGEAHVLAHLLEVGACPIGGLHAAFAHRRSTLTGILDRLEARGLVRRGPNPDDRRSFMVALTTKGRALAAAVHGRLAALERAVARQVTPAQIAGFEAVVERLAREARREEGRE